MTDILFHEHKGQVYPLREGAETMLFGIWYTRWLCSSPACSSVLLVIKRDQSTKVADGGVVSAYGFTVGEVVAEKRTGRKAKIMKFGPVGAWRTVNGGRVRYIRDDMWTIDYRWIEPAEGRTRMVDSTFVTDHTAFHKRFQKLSG